MTIEELTEMKRATEAEIHLAVQRILDNFTATTGLAVDCPLSYWGFRAMGRGVTFCGRVLVGVRHVEAGKYSNGLPTIEAMSGLVDDFTDGKSLREYLESIED